jgi:hypothetical protein
MKAVAPNKPILCALGRDLRYVAAWREKWLKWTGTRWEPDKTLAAFDFARKAVRETRRGTAWKP